MLSLIEQLKQVEEKEQNYNAQFVYIEKLESALEKVSEISTSISFLLVLLFFYFLFTYILPKAEITLILFSVIYGGSFLGLLLNESIFKPTVPKVLFYIYKIKQNEYEFIKRKKSQFQYEKKVLLKKINQEYYYEKESKLIEELNSFIENLLKNTIPKDQYVELKKRLEEDHLTVMKFGYQIHKKVYYSNRFNKINSVTYKENNGIQTCFISENKNLEYNISIDSHENDQQNVSLYKRDYSNEKLESKSVQPDIIPTGKGTIDYCDSTEKKQIELDDIPSTDINQMKIINTKSDTDYSKMPTNKVDYSALNEYRNDLGNLGEVYVIEKEKKLLTDKGKSGLSNQVHQISLISDNEGYDVLSFSENGEKKYIEVKTTTGGLYEPFYISARELSAMKHFRNYWIYRVYNFNVDQKRGDIYKIDCNKDFENYYTIQPISFKITPKKV